MFNKSNFCHIASNNRNEQKGSVFIYKTTDTLAQVTQSGYFNEKLIDINVHDLIIHVQYNPVDRTLKKSVLIVTERTLDNVETAPILDQTIGDDIDQLGDQVAGIEEKIPGAASAANQLADKAFVNDIKTAIETTIAEINTSIGTLNNDLSQTNQNLSQTNQNLSQTNQNLSQTNQTVDSLQETKQDKATAVNYDNITNCITEIPQDIKLELNNGTLTLKAGSKVYVPNGFETDGTTPKFDIVTIENDIQRLSADNNTLFLSLNTTDNTITVTTINNAISGSGISPIAYGLVYDTSTNKITKYDASIQPLYNTSFPFAIITSNTTQIVSINQVFNGFGYIDSTAFALPGVKGLIPDGRNEDGTLKNIEFESTKVTTTNLIFGDRYNLAMTTSGKIDQLAGFRYDPEHNYNYNHDRVSTTCNCGVCTRDNDRIISFTPKTAFHAVDYNDTEFITHQAMPSDKYMNLTLGASGATYTAPADGWFYLHKAGNNIGQYLTFLNRGQNNFNMYQDIGYDSTGSSQLTFFMPVKKGDTVFIYYTLGGQTTTFRFIYANGAK